MNVHAKYAAQIFAQEYGKKPAIDGVELIPLPIQSDDSGNFSEIVRLTAGKVESLKSSFSVEQVSISIIKPGAIKAFHIHHTQDDLWYTLPSERLIVNLHDVRKDSPTFDQHMRFVLGGHKNLLLRIPKGVAHGVANRYERDMILLYLTDQKFNIKKPDEYRLPWDTFGSDMWDITQG